MDINPGYIGVYRDSGKMETTLVIGPVGFRLNVLYWSGAVDLYHHPDRIRVQMQNCEKPLRHTPSSNLSDIRKGAFVQHASKSVPGLNTLGFGVPGKP